MEVREYTDSVGRSSFGARFLALEPIAAAKITVAVTRIRLGNLSNVRGVGASVFEFKVDFGPGYRIYFGREGERLVILLAGGTKRRQQHDLDTAKAS